MVLIAASPFLLSKMSTTTPGTSLKVELPADIQLQVASQLVHYLYDGKVTLTTENVAQFARVAKLFRLEHLHKICEDFLYCFQLSTDLLNVQEEQINIFCSKCEEQKSDLPRKTIENKTQIPGEISAQSAVQEHAKPIGKKKMMTLKEKEKNSGLKTPDKAKSCGKNLGPTHAYGTRLASTAKVLQTKAVDEAVEAKVGVMAEKISKQSNMPENNSMKKGKKVTDWPKLLASISSMDEETSELCVKEGEQTSPIQASAIANMDITLDLSDAFLKEDLDSSQFDDSEFFHGKTKTKSSMTASVRKSALLKKSKRLQHKLAKRPASTSLETTTQTLRQPPKKRAREFTQKETAEQESSLLIAEEMFEDAIVEDSLENDTDCGIPVKKMKIAKVPAFLLTKNLISRYCAILEERKPDIPENERQYICNLCGNEFVFPKRLIKHVISNHKLEADSVLDSITIRKYEKISKICDICNYENKEPNFYYMHYHKYFRHGVPLPKGWKPWKCDVCGKEVFTKFQLKDHMLVHTEATPFICEHCGQGFRMRTSLNSHVFHKHSDVRKHQCEQCSKSFKTKTQLSVHIRSHTGEKPFACYDKDCDYRSTTRGNMRLHLNNKHHYDIDLINDYMAKLQKTEHVPKPRAVFETDTLPSSVQSTKVDLPHCDNMLAREPPDDAVAPASAHVQPVIEPTNTPEKKKYKKKQTSAKSKTSTKSMTSQGKKLGKLKSAHKPSATVDSIGVGNDMATQDNETGVMYMSTQPIILQSVDQSNTSSQYQQQQQQVNILSVVPLNLAQLQNAAIVQTGQSSNQHYVIQNSTDVGTLLSTSTASVITAYNGNIPAGPDRRQTTTNEQGDMRENSESSSSVPAILATSGGQLIVLNKARASVMPQVGKKLCIDKHPGLEIHIPMEPNVVTSSTMRHESASVGYASRNRSIVVQPTASSVIPEQQSSNAQTNAVDAKVLSSLMASTVHVSQSPTVHRHENYTF